LKSNLQPQVKKSLYVEKKEKKLVLN